MEENTEPQVENIGFLVHGNPSPDWNVHGIIPPFLNEPTEKFRRSPYTDSLLDFALRFSFSLERIRILQGLMEYRSRLHSIGIVSGFQWFNGSFLENAEMIRQTPPKDIDITTFFYLPDGMKSDVEIYERYPELFSSKQLKRSYLVDGYCVCLNRDQPFCTREFLYWYSLWSHQRGGNFVWKGFVQIDLKPRDDKSVIEILKDREKSIVGE
jgi:hypothetical protein